MLPLDQKQVTTCINFRPPLSLHIAHSGHGRWWNILYETKFCFLWMDPHIHIHSLGIWTASLTTANSASRVNKITSKRRGCPQGGFRNFSSPGLCKCEVSAHERNGLHEWPRARLCTGRGDANFSGNCASLSHPFCFLCSRPDPSVQGFCKEEKVFSLVA